MNPRVEKKAREEEMKKKPHPRKIQEKSKAMLWETGGN